MRAGDVEQPLGSLPLFGGRPVLRRPLRRDGTQFRQSLGLGRGRGGEFVEQGLRRRVLLCVADHQQLARREPSRRGLALQLHFAAYGGQELGCGLLDGLDPLLVVLGRLEFLGRRQGDRRNVIDPRGFDSAAAIAAGHDGVLGQPPAELGRLQDPIQGLGDLRPTQIEIRDAGRLRA